MNVAIRADASPVIGSGHVMRCLALADALARRGARIRFLCRALPLPLEQRLTAAGHALTRLPEGSGVGTGNAGGDLAHSLLLGVTQEEDAAASAAALAEALPGAGWDWVVVDHYAIDHRWQRRLRGSTRRILAIDDLADRVHDCDVLLDQNPQQPERYRDKVPAACRLLLGLRYALLRDEFAAQRRQVEARSGAVRRVLVYFGADPAGSTLVALDALRLAAAGLAADVVINSHHPQRVAIERACAEVGHTCHLDTSRMAALIAAADLGIGASGSSSWERCCLGLPAIVFSLAVNQQAPLDEAAAQGLVYAPGTGAPAAAALALHLGALLDNPRLLRRLSRTGMATVDGLGADRVGRLMAAGDVSMRLAVAADSDALFRWRNHPVIRRASRHPAPVERATHEAWLAAVLADDRRLLLIGECQGGPVGVVRFDVQGEEAEVSIYLVPDEPGGPSSNRGLGVALLLSAEAWLAASRRDVTALSANVLTGNEPSHRLFESCGYHLHSSTYGKVLGR